MRATITTLAAVACLVVGLILAERAVGNGGPFLVKYPNGDPAAKGTLARLDPTLRPARETRLRVVKEDLTVTVPPPSPRGSRDEKLPPVVSVSAAYTIENPTDDEVKVDFGFPILRGVYVIRGMGLWADVRVAADKENIRADIISNSVIYGIIRQHARSAIDKAISSDAELARLVAAVQEARPPVQPAAGAQPTANAPAVQPSSQQAVSQQSTAQQAAPTSAARATPALNRAREALRSYLVAAQKWNGRDAALMVEYASLDFGVMKSPPRDLWYGSEYVVRHDEIAKELVKSNLGPLSAVGEQRATQFFAQLASKFDKNVAADYEAIFAAWGGDVRERSVDLRSGQVRPREVDAKAEKAAIADRPSAGDIDQFFGSAGAAELDPTVYARVDYLDPKAPISDLEKASCLAVLKNLPVTFTFAPMNLLHYQVMFPAKATRVVTIAYRQYAYTDTAGGGSYQLAYVLHPATLWNDFGPINLAVRAPKGVACKASVALEKREQGAPAPTSATVPEVAIRADALETYEATLVDLKDKSGELFVGIDKAGWEASAPKPTEPKAAKAAALPTAGTR